MSIPQERQATGTATIVCLKYVEKVNPNAPVIKTLKSISKTATATSSGEKPPSTNPAAIKGIEAIPRAE